MTHGAVERSGNSSGQKVALLRAKDRTAWQAFVAENDTEFRHYVAGLTGRTQQVADDIVQEAYIKIFLKLRWLRDPDALMAWCYRILHRTTIEWFRKNGKIMQTALDDDIAVCRDVPVGDRHDAIESLASLSLALRSVILLVDGYGFDYAETGRILGIPPGTVGSRLNTARSKLRRSGGVRRVV